MWCVDLYHDLRKRMRELGYSHSDGIGYRQMGVITSWHCSNRACEGWLGPWRKAKRAIGADDKPICAGCGHDWELSGNHAVYVDVGGINKYDKCRNGRRIRRGEKVEIGTTI